MLDAVERAADQALTQYDAESEAKKLAGALLILGILRRCIRLPCGAWADATVRANPLVVGRSGFSGFAAFIVYAARLC